MEADIGIPGVTITPDEKWDEIRGWDEMVVLRRTYLGLHLRFERDDDAVPPVVLHINAEGNIIDVVLEANDSSDEIEREIDRYREFWTRVCADEAAAS